MALNPAKKIIDSFGGERVVADIVGASYTAPYRWQYPVVKGGTGGRIPQKHIQTLLAAAKERGISLSLPDFFDEGEK